MTQKKMMLHTDRVGELLPQAIEWIGLNFEV